MLNRFVAPTKFQAHSDCDVSAGNILIYNLDDLDDPETNEVVGLLADWDLAKTEDKLTTRSVSLE